MHFSSEYGELNWFANFYKMYNGILDGSIGGPFVFRLFTVKTIQTLSEMPFGLAPHEIGMVMELMALVVFQFVFYGFLKQYLLPKNAFTGVLLVNFLLCYVLSQFVGITLVEITDIFNLLLMACILILFDKVWVRWSILLLTLSILNRETPLVLLPMLAWINWKNKRPLVETILLIVLPVMVYVLLRVVIPLESGGIMLFDFIDLNIPFLSMENTKLALKSNFLFVLLMGPLYALVAIHFRQLPYKLKWLVVTSVLFLVIHVMVGIMHEARLWMPMFLFLIPAAIYNLNKWFNSNGNQETSV